jgi:hypothetical protein
LLERLISFSFCPWFVAVFRIFVIAISGEFNGASPAGLIADAFFTKGQYPAEELFRKIADLIEQSPLRPNLAKPDRAPVWIPRTDAGYLVVTCTDCLGSFSVPFPSLMSSWMTVLKCARLLALSVAQLCVSRRPHAEAEKETRLKTCNIA